MALDKTLTSGSTTLLLLKLLDGQEMYGYQMIEELRRRSDHTFDLKAGTLYPLLHTLEQNGFVTVREETPSTSTGRPRRYYRLTESGRKQLQKRESEWRAYASAVSHVLDGGVCYVG